jgi:hypothetical protein
MANAMKSSKTILKYLTGIIIVLLICQMAGTTQTQKGIFDPPQLGYGDVDWNAERGLLESIAAQLRSSPDSFVLAIFYGGPKSCRQDARRRAIRASKFMAKECKITDKQFVWRDGGFDEQAKVDAYLLPNSFASELTSFPHYRPPKPEWKIKNCK